MIYNINPKTGIRYGVISANRLSSEIVNEFDMMYPESSEDDDYIEAIGASYKSNGYEVYHHFEDNEIWVIKSPYVTHCQLCSPCAPNAGDLSSPDIDGFLTYCLDSTFFDDEKAPYMYKPAEDRRKILDFYELAPEWQQEAISNLGEETAKETKYLEPMEGSNPYDHILWDLNSCNICNIDGFNGVITLSNNSAMLLKIDAEFKWAIIKFI